MYPGGGCSKDGVNCVMTNNGDNNHCIWVADNINADGVRKLAMEVHALY